MRFNRGRTRWLATLAGALVVGGVAALATAGGVGPGPAQDQPDATLVPAPTQSISLASGGETEEGNDGSATIEQDEGASTPTTTLTPAAAVDPTPAEPRATEAAPPTPTATPEPTPTAAPESTPTATPESTPYAHPHLDRGRDAL